MKQEKLYNSLFCVILFLCFSTGCITTGAQVKDVPAVKLDGRGVIKCSGGCEMYMEGFITLIPRGDSVDVEINNDGFFFVYNKKRFKSFSVTLPAAVVNRFLGQVKMSIESDQVTGMHFTTAENTATLDIPVFSGRLKGSYEEVLPDNGDYTCSLFAYITIFVNECCSVHQSGNKI